MPRSSNRPGGTGRAVGWCRSPRGIASPTPPRDRKALHRRPGLQRCRGRVPSRGTSEADRSSQGAPHPGDFQPDGRPVPGRVMGASAQLTPVAAPGRRGPNRATPGPSTRRTSRLWSEEAPVGTRSPVTMRTRHDCGSGSPLRLGRRGQVCASSAALRADGSRRMTGERMRETHPGRRTATMHRPRRGPRSECEASRLGTTAHTVGRVVDYVRTVGAAASSPQTGVGPNRSCGLVRRD